MRGKTPKRPTEGELAILRVLWERGPSTVRTVHERLGGTQRTGYTTTLKLMQIMAAKGLVKRDQSRMTHVYAPAIEEGPTRRRLVRDFLDRAFGGSAGKLVMQALDAGDISPEELQEIRQLLEKKGAANERAR